MSNKTQYARIIQVITAAKDEWAERLGLAHWHIEHVFLDSFYGDDGEEDFKVTAVTESRWQYMQAKIKWYLPSAIRHDDDELIRVLVHELCHVLLAVEQVLIDERLGIDGDGSTSMEFDALQARFYEHLEHATENTTRAILKAHNLAYLPIGDACGAGR